MKHLKTFNEKLGISKSLEEQVEYYHKIMMDNPDKKEYNFVYKTDKGNFTITVFIKDNLGDQISGQAGQLSNGDLYINLLNRNDVTTLLHEVKHIDYSIRKGKYEKDSKYTKAHNSLYKNDIKGDMKYLSTLFYLMDENEFQSKYHTYYKDFDLYLKKHLSTDSTNREKEIVKMWPDFLKQHHDGSWSWYKQGDFKFLDYVSRNSIYDAFHNYIMGNKGVISKPDYKPSGSVYLDFIKYFKRKMRKIINPNVVELTSKEKEQVSILKKRFEKEITIKRDRYFKRMSRIPTLMIDKWVKKD